MTVVPTSVPNPMDPAPPTTNIPVTEATVNAGLVEDPNDPCVKLNRLQFVDRPWPYADAYKDPDTGFWYTKAQYALMFEKCRNSKKNK